MYYIILPYLYLIWGMGRFIVIQPMRAERKKIKGPVKQRHSALLHHGGNFAQFCFSFSYSTKETENLKFIATIILSKIAFAALFSSFFY